MTALTQCNAADMTDCLNDLTRGMFSFFDVGTEEPERFCYGRYDVVLEPCDKNKDVAFILEFKSVKSGTLDEGVKATLAQIAEKEYSEDLQHRSISADCIHAFDIAFSGKDVLVVGA